MTVSVKKKDYMSWDTYFMSVAVISSFRSKDPKTQTGACIVDSQKKIVGMGYNGLPKGCDDDNPIFWSDEDENAEFSKHSYVIHAEKNAIYNSISYDLTGATIYITLHPCPNCAQAVIQVGIKRVVYLDMKEHHEKENKAVRNMFASAGVELISYQEIETKDKNFIEKLRELTKFYLD